ncbi:MAG: Hpt domain-containing protein [Planctomycetia bacterium]|nr:Hpt domain-containing protein [Planctomycetia bacterium]
MSDKAKDAGHASSHATAPIWQLIDRDATLARLGGDEQLFNELVGFFLEDEPGLLRDLTEAVERQDFDAAERAGHSLKGLAANLGATAAARAGHEVEASAREKDSARLALAAKGAIPEFARVVEALKQFQASLA